jgi:hypothetical protein
VFQGASEGAQGVERVFRIFVFFASSAGVEDCSFSRENRSLRIRDLSRNDVLVSFENGGSVESLPISMIGAGGNARVMASTSGKHTTIVVLPGCEM